MNSYPLPPPVMARHPCVTDGVRYGPKHDCPMKWLTYRSQGHPQMRPGNETVSMAESV